MKFILLTILFGGLALSLNAQNTNEACINCGSSRDSVLVQLSTGEQVYTLKPKSGETAEVSHSRMAQYRKTINCPDIFAQPEPEPEPVIETTPPRVEVKPEIKVIDKKQFFLPDPVFFRINRYVIDPSEWSKVELAVDYLNKNPGATVVVTGYADKKTGNDKINMKLSEQRSTAVARALETKYGINRSRISVNWKGDGLQPFQLDNDKNRAVLFLINP